MMNVKRNFDWNSNALAAGNCIFRSAQQQFIVDKPDPETFNFKF